MSSIGQRIKQRRTELKLTQGQVGQLAGGLAYQTIQDLENGASKRTKHIVAIAHALKVDPHWLETGEGPIEVEETVRPAPTTELNISAMPMDVPVRGSAACGKDGLFEMNGQTLAHVRRPPRLMGVKGVYALYVHGESMAPWREHGQLVYVHPHQPPRVNDYVVVQLHSDGGEDDHRSPDHNFPAYIKRLVKQTATQLILHQYRPDGDIKIPLEKVKSVHRIVDWDELMGF